MGVFLSVMGSLLLPPKRSSGEIIRIRTGIVKIRPVPWWLRTAWRALPRGGVEATIGLTTYRLLAEGGEMNFRTYLVLLGVACVVLGGCTIPSISVNIEPGETPGGEVTTPPLEEITPLVVETPASEPPPSEPEAPTPTNTLVVPPTSEETPAPEPPGAAPTEEPETPPQPVPTAIVDPELAALWDWALALEDEVFEPVEEMLETLDDLGLGSGQGDIFAICTGVDVVVATLGEVQQGLDRVGRPPVDDPDLNLAYDEASAAVDDLEQCFQLFQSACQTMDFGKALEAKQYFISGVEHLENAAGAMERWQNKVGL
jgi:hypothetical protein